MADIAADGYTNLGLATDSEGLDHRLIVLPGRTENIGWSGDIDLPQLGEISGVGGGVEKGQGKGGNGRFHPYPSLIPVKRLRFVLPLKILARPH